jgi:hypothetical protein
LEEKDMEPKERLKEQVDQRSTQAGQQVNTVADDVRTVADQLRSQGKDKPAQYAQQAAERVESVGQWLERSDGDQILSDVEGFARRNPWAVAAGGLVLGLAASRFLKASSGERYRASLSSANGGGAAATAPPVTGAPAVQSDRAFDGGEFSHQEGSMVTSEPRV